MHLKVKTKLFFKKEVVHTAQCPRCGRELHADSFGSPVWECSDWTCAFIVGMTKDEEAVVEVTRALTNNSVGILFPTTGTVKSGDRYG